MKEGTTYKNFEDCLTKVKYPRKILANEYLQKGLFPIVSQEEELISGYWNNEEDLFCIKKPVVIFGDHTRVLKYIDFDFVMGADGVKLLVPKDEIKAKFLYFFLKWQSIPSLGYSRHYKLLKEIIVPVPSLEEQEGIVAELDCIGAIIADKKQQLRELDNLAQAIFYEMFGDPITNPKGWEIKKWSEVLTIVNGKNQKEVENPNGQYVICGSGGIMGRANKYLCPPQSVIIGRKGSINNPILMREYYWNVDTAFGLIPKKEVLLVDYFYGFCQCFDFTNLDVSVTMPSLRKADLIQIAIPIPPLALQEQFAEKVKAIEEQKEMIRQSIAEFESLFAQRMEYHFA